VLSQVEGIKICNIKLLVIYKSFGSQEDFLSRILDRISAEDIPLKLVYLVTEVFDDIMLYID
jgi:hypothetical protein